MAADLDALGAAVDEGGTDVALVRYPAVRPGELDGRLEQLARDCASDRPWLSWRVAATEDEPIGEPLPSRPALALEVRGAQPIRYLALPEGHEWPPFLWVLDRLAARTPPAAAPPPAPAPAPSPPARSHRPPSLLVLMASECPHCPRAVQAALEVALGIDQATVHVVDVQLFPELATRFEVRTVPTTILDDGLTITEVLSAARLDGLVRARGTTEHEHLVFDSLVASGRLEAASASLGARGGAERLYAAWAKSTTNTRIGLMLAAERALEAAPGCLTGAVPLLGGLLGRDDPALVGDTADLLGRIGHATAVPLLRALQTHSNADVAEAAADALAALEHGQP